MTARRTPYHGESEEKRRTCTCGTELGESVYSATQPNNHMKHRNESKDTMELRIPTFALAFLYASVHVWEKSGTNAGLSTGGGCLGKLAGYTSKIGGPEEGEGKGMNIYGVVGMTDGPGCVSGPLLVAVVSRAGVDALMDETGKSEGDTLSLE